MASTSQSRGVSSACRASMSSARFNVRRHQTPCQHIREYPGAAKYRQEDTFRLDVKQYVPVDNPRPRDGDITIIAAQGNGFPKVELLAGVFLSLRDMSSGLDQYRSVTSPCGMICFHTRTGAMSGLEEFGSRTCPINRPAGF